jgi:hypothetical protein
MSAGGLTMRFHPRLKHLPATLVEGLNIPVTRIPLCESMTMLLEVVAAPAYVLVGLFPCTSLGLW